MHFSWGKCGFCRNKHAQRQKGTLKKHGSLFFPFRLTGGLKTLKVRVGKFSIQVLGTSSLSSREKVQACHVPPKCSKAQKVTKVRVPDLEKRAKATPIHPGFSRRCFLARSTWAPALPKAPRARARARPSNNRSWSRWFPWSSSSEKPQARRSCSSSTMCSP